MINQEDAQLKSHCCENKMEFSFILHFPLKLVYYRRYELIYRKRRKFCLTQGIQLCPEAIGGPICAVKKFARNPRDGNALKLLSTSMINRFRETFQQSSLAFIYNGRLVFFHCVLVCSPKSSLLRYEFAITLRESPAKFLRTQSKLCDRELP